jgi:hypothetical protein
MVGIDGGHQLRVAIRSDSSTDRAAHPSTSTEDPDARRHNRKSTQPEQDRKDQSCLKKVEQ